MRTDLWVCDREISFWHITTGDIHWLELVQWSAFGSAFLRQYSLLCETIESIDNLPVNLSLLSFFVIKNLGC